MTYIKKALKKELKRGQADPDHPGNLGPYEYTVKSIHHYLTNLLPSIDHSLQPTPHNAHLGRNYDPRKPLLVLDMDETLLHSVVVANEEDANTVVFSPGGTKILLNIVARPHVDFFLTEAKKVYNLVLFTASEEYYAKEAIQLIDPRDQFFVCKLFKDSCSQLASGHYVKDLRVFGTELLDRVLLVDNSPNCYSAQLDNGVPIVDFRGDPHDTELPSLLDYLKALLRMSDIVKTNRNYFRLRKMLKTPVWSEALKVFTKRNKSC